MTRNGTAWNIPWSRLNDGKRYGEGHSCGAREMMGKGMAKGIMGACG
jgi:hypothetical protein